ncbi:hypothetical protein CFP65_7087 [Kitasatospora sp. MMS16-BH015]|uniref:hypothetical protein n=1 Tax=Kitasatospora sp. MMS16-BH015 TaxID=2018025 RepID=UPI000CA1F75B|nr:hypothetical protein [Kitasatospora sp. MMS16-BH015]AUG81691.1 hypothetical protein CFP65_7087 [Kitasatospora sp. MMS16-BH015]
MGAAESSRFGATRIGRRPGRAGPSLPRPGEGLVGALLGNVRTGRFQRSLALATGLGSLVTGAEIFLEHDRAGFGNRVMWWPVVLGPIGGAAGLAGAASPRAARTLLPVASAAIAANGLQGTWLHVRGIAQKPGGWAMARYNVELGPPLFAPLLMSMVGGMGLVAAVLRREGTADE